MSEKRRLSDVSSVLHTKGEKKRVMERLIGDVPRWLGCCFTNRFKSLLKTNRQRITFHERMENRTSFFSISTFHHFAHLVLSSCILHREWARRILLLDFWPRIWLLAVSEVLVSLLLVILSILSKSISFPIITDIMLSFTRYDCKPKAAKTQFTRVLAIASRKPTNGKVSRVSTRALSLPCGVLLIVSFYS